MKKTDALHRTGLSKVIYFPFLEMLPQSSLERAHAASYNYEACI
jgi:hypothetical protein